MQQFVAHLLFYPTLAWNLLLRRLIPARRWWDAVDDHVLIGALPLKWIVPQLESAGVKAVVNLCEEFPGPTEAYQRAGIQQIHLPTIDFTPPSLGDVQRAVDFIQQHASCGRTVYVHCKAGRGRSGTVVLCWLIKSKNITPEQAQKVLQEKRPHVVRSLFRRPVVQKFYAHKRGGDS